MIDSAAASAPASRSDPRRYHEMLDGEGRIRPQWQGLARELARATPAQMRQRMELVTRTIRENGVSYNVYADPKGEDRPWDLDLLPNPIGAEEWQRIATGVMQRADLLNRVLADLYGPRELLREGLLPAELIYGHNNYLWPCEGLRPPGDVHLHLYAADLCRAVDGTWWLMADRTQAPSGAGYALENRAILSQAFPDLLHELPVRGLAGFFSAHLEAVQSLAPVDPGESVLSVLLTPGRFNETYFEHVYLARQLGVPLVEGQDLTVRGGTVFLKTLHGLRRVHAVLRRVDDDFCDPLELRGDSRLGVPGLVDAVRAGRVLVTNALGTGVLESPGLIGFLPAVSRRLLGQPLLLPSVATWWCGEPAVCASALAQLDRLVLKPAFPSQRLEPVFGHALGAAQLAELRARISVRPSAYVAQEVLQLSQAPIWRRDAGRLQFPQRAIGMRVYACWTPQGYRVMPGGLTRVAGQAGADVISMQRGGGSKDTWVLGDAGDAVAASATRPRIGRAGLVRADALLTSRTGENLFWLGRYCERADNTVRMLRAVLTQWLEGAGGIGGAFARRWCESVDVLLPGLALREAATRAIADPEHAESLRTVIDRAAFAAAQVRGRLSQEHWRGMRELQRQIHAIEDVAPEPGAMLEMLAHLSTGLAAQCGFALDDMTRDDGWRMLLLGRGVERLQCFGDLLAFALRQPRMEEPGLLAVVLELANCTITYRMRYHSLPQLLPVLDLVACDVANPHSLRYQAEHLTAQVAKLPLDGALSIGQTMGALLATLPDDLLHPLEDGGASTSTREALAERFAACAELGRNLSDRFSMRYFSHVDDLGLSTQSA